jgi:hypothetical protein
MEQQIIARIAELNKAIEIIESYDYYVKYIADTYSSACIGKSKDEIKSVLPSFLFNSTPFSNWFENKFLKWGGVLSDNELYESLIIHLDKDNLEYLGELK